MRWRCVLVLRSCFRRKFGRFRVEDPPSLEEGFHFADYLGSKKDYSDNDGDSGMCGVLCREEEEEGGAGRRGGSAGRGGRCTRGSGGGEVSDTNI